MPPATAINRVTDLPIGVYGRWTQRASFPLYNHIAKIEMLFKIALEQGGEFPLYLPISEALHYNAERLSVQSDAVNICIGIYPQCELKWRGPPLDPDEYRRSGHISTADEQGETDLSMSIHFMT